MYTYPFPRLFLAASHFGSFTSQVPHVCHVCHLAGEFTCVIMRLKLSTTPALGKIASKKTCFTP